MSQLLDVNAILGKVWTTTKRFDLKDNASLERIGNPVKYIHPKLKKLHHVNDGPIIIISAPGAVGKTTFAKHAAAQKKGLYWDLAKMKLGDNSFIGTIAKSFGTNDLTSFLTSLSSGEVSLFIDAFDEAEIISGIDGVEKFVRDIYDNCKDSPRPNVVFFSRSETAEFLQLQLMDIASENHYSTYEIDYFDKVGATHFIEHSLTQKNDLSYQTHKKPFERALTHIFSTIAKGMNGNGEVWDDDDVRSFVGYAPVLQTIATYLNNENFEEVANRFSKGDTEKQGIKVISNFIKTLLTRENGKLVSQIKDEYASNHPEWNNWDQLYSEEEQLNTLLSFILGEKKIFPIIELPEWLRQPYQEAVFSFLPNHPFLKGRKFSSPAFRDFTLANLMFSDALGEICSNHISNGRFVVTSLFAYFYQNKNNNRCDGRHAGYLYESAISRRGAEDSMLMTFVKEKSDGLHEIEIVNPDGHQANNLKFEFGETDDLVIERRLANAIIRVNCNVILGKKDGSIELSDVEIRSNEITFRATDCLLKTTNESSIVLCSEVAKTESPAFNLKKIGNGVVEVHWEGAEVYPWSDYHTPSLGAKTSDLMEEFYALKRILSPFRKHGRDEFAKQMNFIENVIVGTSELRQRILYKLIQKSILRKDGSQNQYFVNEENLNAIGITWSDIKRFNITSDVKKVLEDLK